MWIHVRVRSGVNQGVDVSVTLLSLCNKLQWTVLSAAMTRNIYTNYIYIVFNCDILCVQYAISNLTLNNLAASGHNHIQHSHVG